MIPKNIKESAERRLTAIKEEFEDNYEIYFNDENFINHHDGSDYPGFWSFVDGSLTLNVDLIPWNLLGSGNYPNYLQKCVTHVEQLSHEYAIEHNNDRYSDEYQESYDEYLQDEYVTVQFRFMWYGKNKHGNGKNKLYCDCFLVDEYNQVIHKEIVGDFDNTIQEIEFHDLSDIDTIFDKMLEALKII